MVVYKLCVKCVYTGAVWESKIIACFEFSIKETKNMLNIRDLQMVVYFNIALSISNMSYIHKVF